MTYNTLILLVFLFLSALCFSTERVNYAIYPRKTRAIISKWNLKYGFVL